MSMDVRTWSYFIKSFPSIDIVSKTRYLLLILYIHLTMTCIIIRRLKTVVHSIPIGQKECLVLLSRKLDLFHKPNEIRLPSSFSKLLISRTVLVFLRPIKTLLRVPSGCLWTHGFWHKIGPTKMLRVVITQSYPNTSNACVRPVCVVGRHRSVCDSEPKSELFWLRCRLHVKKNDTYT